MKLSEEMKIKLKKIEKKASDGRNITAKKYAVYELLLPKIEQIEKENELLKHQINEAEKQRDDYLYENNELKEQNEKLKCCGNCKKWHFSNDFPENFICDVTDIVIDDISDKCDLWELDNY